MRKMRKLLSVFMLSFYLLTLFIQNSVLALGVETAETIIDSINAVSLEEVFNSNSIAYSSLEVSNGETMQISLPVADFNVNNYNITYRNKTDGSLLGTYLYMSAAGDHYFGAITANHNMTSGDYVIDSVIKATNDGWITYYNELYYPDQENRVAFSEKEFTVTGTLGKIAPTFDFIFDDKELLPGEHQNMTLKLDLEKYPHEFDSVTLNYRDPIKNQEFNIVMDKTGLGEYSYSETIGQFHRSGEFELNRITFHSPEFILYVYGSEVYKDTEVVMDLSFGNYSVSGTTTDSTAPVLQSVSFTRDKVSPNKPGRIMLDVLESESGIRKASVRLKADVSKIEGQTKYTYIQLELSSENDIFSGDLNIDMFSSSGQYYIDTVFLEDIAGNSVTYTQENTSETELNFNSKSVLVYGTYNNYQPVQSIALNKNSFTLGDKIIVDLEIDEFYDEFHRIVLTYTPNGENSGDFSINFTQVAPGKFRGEFEVMRSMVSDSFSIRNISFINDDTYHSIVINNSKFDTWRSFDFDISHTDIEIGGTIGNLKPTFDLSFNDVSFSPGETISANLDIADDIFNPESLEIKFRHESTRDEYVNMTLLYDSVDGIYKGTFSGFTFKKPGVYKAEYVSFYENGDYYSFYSEEYAESYNKVAVFNNASFELIGTYGDESLELILNTNKPEYTVGEYANLSLNLSDIAVTADSVMITIGHEEETYSYGYTLNYNSSTGLYEGVMNISSGSRPGKYIMKSIYINNEWLYETSQGYGGSGFSIGNNYFSVLNPLYGYTPAFTIDVTPKEAVAGDTVKTTLTIPENVTEYTTAEVTILSPDGKSNNISMKNIGFNKFEYSKEINQYTKSGEYKILAIYLFGPEHSIWMYNQNYDLGAGNYSVSGTIEDSVAPVISEIIVPEIAEIGSKYTVIVKATDDLSGVESVELYYEMLGQYTTQWMTLTNKGEYFIGTSDLYDWHYGEIQIREIVVSDKAGNSTAYWNENHSPVENGYLSLGQGELITRVKDRILENLSITTDKEAYGPDEVVKVRLTTDTKEKLNIDLTYNTPDKSDVVLVDMHYVSDGIYEGSYTVKPYSDAGEYALERLSAYGDGYNINLQHGDSELRGHADLSGGNFSIEGTIPDTIAPVLKEVRFGKSNIISKGFQRFTLVTEETGGGVSSAQMTMVNQTTGDTQKINLSSSQQNVLATGVALYDGWTNGLWQVTEVYVEDVFGNGARYLDHSVSGEGTRMDLRKFSFSVYNVRNAATPIKYVGTTLNKELLAMNEQFVLTLNLENPDKQSVSMDISFINESGERFSENFVNLDGFEEVKIKEYAGNLFYGIEPGKYQIYAIDVRNEYNQVMLINDPSVIDVEMEGADRYDVDLSHLDFEITERNVLPTENFIHSITISPSEPKSREEISITAVPGSELVNVNTMVLFYRNDYGYNTLPVRLTKNNDGNFSGSFIYDEYVYEPSTLGLSMIRYQLPGRTVEVHDLDYGFHSNHSDLSVGDFTIQPNDEDVPSDDTERPELLSFTMPSGEFCPGDRAYFSFELDKPESIDGLYVSFKIDGKNAYTYVSLDEFSKFMRIARYSESGAYSIDKINVIYGNGLNYTVYNSLYYDQNSIYNGELREFGDTFTVSGTEEDMDFPQFESIHVDRTSVKHGEAVIISVNASDMQSGLDYAEVVYKAPDSTDFGKTIVLYPTPTGELQGKWNITEDLVDGAWELSHILIYDRAGNRSWYRNVMTADDTSRFDDFIDGDHVSVLIGDEGEKDEVPPVLKNIELTSLMGESYFVLDIEDVSGIREINLDLVNSMQSYRTDFYEFSHEGKYYVKIPAYFQYAKEDLHLIRVRITDYADNRMDYRHGMAVGDPGVKNFSSLIYQTKQTPYPVVSNISLSTTTPEPGESITVTMDIENMDDSLRSYAVFKSGNYDTHYLELQKVSGNTYESRFSFAGDVTGKSFELSSIEFSDNFTESYYAVLDLAAMPNDWQTEYTFMDLSSYYFRYTAEQNPEVPAGTHNPVIVDNIKIVSVNEVELKNYNNENGILVNGLTVPKVKSGDRIVIELDGYSHAGDLEELYLQYRNRDRIWYYTLGLTKVGESKYQTTMLVHDYINSGEWEMDSIMVHDVNGNGYYEENHYHDGALEGYEKAHFYVDQPIDDFESPLLLDVSVDQTTVTKGDVVKYQVHVEELLSGIQYIQMEVVGTYSQQFIGIELEEVSEGMFEGYLDTTDLGDDLWRVHNVSLEDKAFRQTSVLNKDYYDMSNYYEDGIFRYRKDFSKADVSLMTITSLELVSKPNKLKYYVGETLDLRGLVVEAILSDGSRLPLSIEDLTIAGFDSSKPQENQEITITYKDHSTKFSVSVEDITLSSIEVTKLPNKTQYYIGDTLDITGLVVTGTYSNNEKAVLDIALTDIEGFSSTTPQAGQVLTVTKNGKTANFTVDILEVVLENLVITKQPLKKTYYVGDAINLNGLVVTGTYSNGKSEILTVTSDDVEGFSSLKPVNGQIITIRKFGKTATFTIDVLAVELTSIRLLKTPLKTNYKVGEELDIEGLEVEGTFNNGKKELIPSEQMEFIGFDSTAAMEGQKVTVKVNSFEAYFTLNIQEGAKVEVLAGSNRFGTAVNISSSLYETADVAILVQARNFPDALAAGPLAFMHNAPILLTNTPSLSTATKAELQRLGVKKVLLMGGESAISLDVENGLKADGYTVERVKGSNRYGTAVETAKQMQVGLGTRKTVVLASGVDFADALAAGSFAAKNGYPIILTDGGRLTKTTSDYLSESGVENIIIVGGTGVIKEALADSLKAAGYKVTRQSGSNRMNTSVTIAESFFASSTKAIVANGWEFADALAAAPYAAKINAPILLVRQGSINAGIRAYLQSSGIQSVTVVGGNGAVGEIVREELELLLENK